MVHATAKPAAATYIVNAATQDSAPGKEGRHAAAYPEKSTSTYYSIVILGLNELLLLTAICRSLRVYYSVLEIRVR